MKAGDYVKFKDKRGNTYIRKVIDGYKAHWYGCKVDKEANNVPYVSEKNIIKSSPNIIDLIEAGDYVNGLLVIEDSGKSGYVELYLHGYWINTGEDKLLSEVNIESIVTKEQFESMEYKVGD